MASDAAQSATELQAWQAVHAVLAALEAQPPQPPQPLPASALSPPRARVQSPLRARAPSPPRPRAQHAARRHTGGDPCSTSSGELDASLRCARIPPLPEDGEADGLNASTHSRGHSRHHSEAQLDLGGSLRRATQSRGSDAGSSGHGGRASDNGAMGAARNGPGTHDPADDPPHQTPEPQQHRPSLSGEASAPLLGGNAHGGQGRPVSGERSSGQLPRPHSGRVLVPSLSRQQQRASAGGPGGVPHKDPGSNSTLLGTGL
jgi:hypothetical protein